MLKLRFQNQITKSQKPVASSQKLKASCQKLKAKSFLTTLLFIIFFINANAQEIKYNEDIDKETYKYYEEKNWDKLIEVGNDARDMGINFHYLNLRIGIAYSQKQNFRLAISFYKEALFQKPLDPFTMEYLYYAYLGADRENDASVLAKKISKEIKEEYKIKKKPFFGGIYIDGNILYNNQIEKLENIDIDATENIYGEQSFITNHKLFSVGLKNNIGNRLILNSNFSSVFMNQKQFINFYETEYNFNTTSSQQEYYFNLNYHFTESYNLSVAFNLLDIKTTTNVFNQNLSYTDLITHDTQNVFDTISQANAILDVYDTIFNYNEIISHTISDSTVEWNDFVFAISFWRDIKLFRIGLHGNYSKLNNKNFVQTGATLVYFPFGNLNLYSRTDFITKLDFFKKTYLSTRPGFYIKQLVGFKIFKNQKFFRNFWTECFYSYGTLSDYSSHDAFLVYNTGETIKHMGGLNFSYLMFNQKLKLSLSIIFMQKEYEFLTYMYYYEYDKVFEGIRHESFTYEDNSISWTDPQEIESTEATKIYMPVLFTEKYLNFIISGGLSFNF